MATSGVMRKPGLRIWGALVVMAIVLQHLPAFFHRLLDGDEAIYSSVAALMNGGGALYAGGGGGNKPPGIFWGYTPTFHAAGAFPKTGLSPPWAGVGVGAPGVPFASAPAPPRGGARPPSR